MADPFATHADLAARWRTLSADEQTRADVLLADASAIVRATAKGIDAKITAGTVDATIPKTVVCEMVKRAMQGPADFSGVTQQQEGAGPFSRTFQFANPTGDLYLTKAEKQWLGIGVQRAGNIDLVPTRDDDESSSSSSSS